MNTPPTPSIALHQLSLYNTGRMASEQVIAAFAARMPLLERMVADIASEKPRSRPQHHLIVGQRGMGKTMLLARIAAELRTKPELSHRLIPLIFAEEQYAIDRLSKFWLNCLDSLADARELTKDEKAVTAIDAAVARLTSTPTRSVQEDQPFADAVYAAFAQAAAASGQRPVLLVDNLQLVFERLQKPQQHSLRELLMRQDAPILVGASPSPPPQTQDYGAAFYDHFKVHYLRPLEEGEMQDLLLHLAANAGRDDVRLRILQQPTRLKVLRQLTGGNPRTTLTLFFLYAEDFSPTVFGDLEGLLDRVTPLYKARFEELTAQQQVIASAIANNWDPITAVVVSQNTALPASTISSQLDRLDKIGMIEQVDLFGESKFGYQIAERFFNIWFLMRSASRRQRREVEFLTRFLESFYEPPDRARLARQLMSENRISLDRYLWSRAVADSLTEPETAEELRRHTELLALREEAAEAHRKMRELLDFSCFPPATLAFDDLRKKLSALIPASSAIGAESFAVAVLGDRSMFISGERERLAARTEKLTKEEIQSVLDSIAKSQQTDVLQYTEEAVAWFSTRLSKGQLRNHTDIEDWNRAFHQAVEAKTIRLMVHSLPDQFGPSLDISSFDRIRNALQPGSDGSAQQWLAWGYTLNKRLSRDSDAELAYRKSISLDNEYSMPWYFLGNLLTKINRHNEAESAYKESIAKDPKFSWPWNGLGTLLKKHLGRPIEAEKAYRECIARDPQNNAPWINLANLLEIQLKRYPEAADAYREALKINPNSEEIWLSLGMVLQEHIGNFTDAESAYIESARLCPKSPLAWALLGDLYQGNLNRYIDAESAYKKAINCDQSYHAGWNELGNLYIDNIINFPEAERCFAKCLEIDPHDEAAVQNLISLRRDFRGDISAAKPLLDQLGSMDKLLGKDLFYLHQGVSQAYEKNWGLACIEFSKALDLAADGIPWITTTGWMRTSAVIFHLDYGSEFLAFLDERGDSIRLRPWVEALRALHLGDRRALQNVAPEIRTTAEIFYDGIAERLAKLPAGTSRRPTAPSTRRKKTRAKK